MVLQEGFITALMQGIVTHQMSCSLLSLEALIQRFGILANVLVDTHMSITCILSKDSSKMSARTGDICEPTKEESEKGNDDKEGSKESKTDLDNYDWLEEAESRAVGCCNSVGPQVCTV